MLNNIPYKREFLGFGETAIINTLTKMRDIINVSYSNPYVRHWAEKILTMYSVPANDKFGEVNAIYDFVRNKVRYTRDPYGLEYIQTPPLLLQMIERNETPYGDCDDYSVLSLSLLKSIGFPVALKIVSYKKNGVYSHVYGLVNIKGKWIPFDAIKQDKFLGWEHPNTTRTYDKEV